MTTIRCVLVGGESHGRALDLDGAPPEIRTVTTPSVRGLTSTDSFDYGKAGPVEVYHLTPGFVLHNSNDRPVRFYLHENMDAGDLDPASDRWQDVVKRVNDASRLARVGRSVNWEVQR